MFTNNPISGVGLDSFEDWYRIARPLSAYKGGDMNEVADSAHNLLLDYAAVGGVSLLIFGLILYSLIIRATLSIVSQSICKERLVSPISHAMTFGSLAFLIQSLVSPQQIGLLSWGFLMMGYVLRFQTTDTASLDRDIIVRGTSKERRLRYSPNSISKKIGAACLAILAVSLSMKLILKDNRMIEAQKSENLSKFVLAVRSYPTSAYHYLNGVSILEESGYLGPAVALGLRGVEEFPRSFFLLKEVSKLRSLDSSRRESLIRQIETLDPPR
jgi:hypothetical protein